MLAGSEVGFRVSWDGNGKYGVFWHPGPAQVYLSRAPDDDLEQYQGDGDFFKIAYAGPVGNDEWMIWNANEVSVHVAVVAGRSGRERYSHVVVIANSPVSSTSPSPRRRRRAGI